MYEVELKEASTTQHWSTWEPSHAIGALLLLSPLSFLLIQTMVPSLTLEMFPPLSPLGRFFYYLFLIYLNFYDTV